MNTPHRPFPLYRTIMMAISAVLLVWIVVVYVQQRAEERLPILRDAPPFSLPSLDGDTVSLARTSGRIRLLYFFFASCPDVCPVTTQMLTRVQPLLGDAFGTRVLFLMATIDATRDTPEQLRVFAERYQIEGRGWVWLRGDEQHAHAVAESYGIAVAKDKKTGAYVHANTIVLIDDKNRVRKRYVGSTFDPNVIRADVQTLLAE
jgi:protein SCO1/2